LKGILGGIRVVELGTHVAIPKAARVLADWGAEVIKVEPPGGEAWRTVGREWGMPCEEDNNPVFQTENANKKSIAVNLKDSRGKEIMDKLLATADVFMTNTRPKALERLGLSYQELKERFPGLIYVHFSAYGKNGPDKDAPGFDSAAFWGRSGILQEWSAVDQMPFRPFPGFGDSTCSGYLAAGVLAALVKKLRTGEGELVELSLYGTALWFNSTGVLMGQPKYGRKYPIVHGTEPNAFVPYYQTKDGDWIVLGSSTWNKHAAAVFRLVGMDKYADDPEYTDLEKSRTHLPEVIAVLREGYAKTSTEAVLSGLAEIGLVHARLWNPREITQDEQAWANGFLREVTMGNGETVVLPNPPVKFESVKETAYHLGPLLGSDSDAVLRALGYRVEEIEVMAEDGCIIRRQKGVS